jgi:hypothetical protein
MKAALSCTRFILTKAKDDGSTPLRSLLIDISTDDEGGATCARLKLKTTEDDDSILLRSLLTENSTDDAVLFVTA